MYLETAVVALIFVVVALLIVALGEAVEIQNLRNAAKLQKQVAHSDVQSLSQLVENLKEELAIKKKAEDDNRDRLVRMFKIGLSGELGGEILDELVDRL